MREGIKIGEIKEAIDHNNETTGSDFFKGVEGAWLTYDAPISGVSEKFDTSFGSTFFVCLPKEYKKYTKENEEDDKKFKEYIEKTLLKGGTAVEFGGPGSKLFRGFSDNFFRKTVGVCLNDIRDTDTEKKDKINNHSVLTGNILDVQNNKLLEKVTKTLDTNKVDLIISRMMGPLDFINKNLAILDRIIRNWYNLLNVNGLMFIQFNLHQDLRIQDLIEKWSTAIKAKFPEIDIQVGNNVLRLHKKKDSPGELPPATQLFK
ncbi:hypothetical protein HYZ82_00915 [Candidatus Nomurabacteria bacterium]|nr:hypothetical protein [Candidatus Nomurabacteria bacterium]